METTFCLVGYSPLRSMAAMRAYCIMAHTTQWGSNCFFFSYSLAVFAMASFVAFALSVSMPRFAWICSSRYLLAVRCVEHETSWNYSFFGWKVNFTRGYILNSRLWLSAWVILLEKIATLKYQPTTLSWIRRELRPLTHDSACGLAVNI